MDKETKQMFELILQKLDNIEKTQDSMEKAQQTMKKSQDSMETKLQSMEKSLGNMETRQGSMEKRQDEIYSVVKAIEHSNNVRKAETDNLTYKVAHVEGTINGIGELIQSRRAIK